MTGRHEKLIRDRIPEIAQREGRTLRVREAEPGEIALLLARKLVEEGMEVHEAWLAGDRSALVLELADLQTVIDGDRRSRRHHARRGGPCGADPS
jgi:predicted house-cleaning noncanonical NTP pyrophosphatase (MazG superfamily)